MSDMSKMHDLSEMIDMRLPSPQIPDEWERDLRQRMVDLGAKSVTAYLEQLIARDLGKEPVKKSWGGNRQVKQDAQVEQDAQLAQDDEDDQVEPPKSVAATVPPSEDQYGVSLLQEINKIAAKMPKEKTVDVKAKPAEDPGLAAMLDLKAKRAAAQAKHPTPPSLNGGRK